MIPSNIFGRLIIWGNTGATIGLIATVLLGAVFKSGLLTNLMLAALGAMLTGWEFTDQLQPNIKSDRSFSRSDFFWGVLGGVIAMLIYLFVGFAG